MVVLRIASMMMGNILLGREKHEVHAMRKLLSGWRVMVNRVNVKGRVQEKDGRTLNYKAEQSGHTSLQSRELPRYAHQGQGQGRR